MISPTKSAISSCILLHSLEWRPRLFAAPFAASGALHRGTKTAQHNLFERLKVSRTVWEAREKGAGDTELTNGLQTCAIPIRVFTPHTPLPPDIVSAGTSKLNVRNGMPSVRFCLPRTSFRSVICLCLCGENRAQVLKSPADNSIHAILLVQVV